MNDQAIEQEIQAKGLAAPRITPADIEANIGAEYFFTAADGVYGADPECRVPASSATHLLTFCVLVLKNGFTVTGESACVSSENFDAEIGRKIARQNAVAKIWPLMGYALRERLAAPPVIQLTPFEAQSGLDRVRWAEGLIRQLPEDHNGRNSWLLNYASEQPDGAATACQGANCGATDGKHSPACIVEAAEVQGWADAPEAIEAKLTTIVRAFIDKHRVYCPETIYIADRVIENAYDLIKELADVVGYHEEGGAAR